MTWTGKCGICERSLNRIGDSCSHCREHDIGVSHCTSFGCERHPWNGKNPALASMMDTLCEWSARPFNGFRGESYTSMDHCHNYVGPEH